MLKKIFYFTLFLMPFLVLLSIRYGIRSEIELSEIVSCNRSSFYDINGFFHDYIELYNSSSHTVDLSGYHLSDTIKNLNRFTFPDNARIEANDYYIVWADKRNEKITNVVNETKYPFAEFSIKNGEKIYLSDRNGKIIDKVKIPQHLACDISFARIPFFRIWAKRTPSPEKQNPLYSERSPKVLSGINIEFSKPSGLYEEPFDLKITAPKGFDIYYTLDSSKPTKNSIKYTKPIRIKDASENENKYSMIKDISIDFEVSPPSFKIDKATIVRAVAIRRLDNAVSEIKNASYFVGFQNKKGYKDIPIVSIVTDPENLFGYENGIYVLGKLWDMNGRQYYSSNPETNLLNVYSNFSVRGKQFSHDVHVDYIAQENISIDGRIKIQGNWSRRETQKSITLFDLKKQKAKESIPTLNLRAFPFNVEGRIVEPLVYSLTKDRNMIPIKYKFVNVFLDGEYWGIYAIYEKITPDFILRNVNLKERDLLDFRRSEKQYGKTQIQFDKNVSYDEIKKKIDIQSMIDYIVINTYIGNRDVCSLFETNNVARWKSRENPEMNKWHWILFDIDDYKTDAPRNHFEDIECSLIEGNELFKTLMQYPEFKEQFVLSFQDIANYNFNSEKVSEFLDEMLAKYRDSFIKTSMRFMPKGYLDDRFIYLIDEMKVFFDNRFEIVMKEMKDYFSLNGDLVEIHKLPSEVDGGYVLLNTLKIAADEEYKGKYFSDYNIYLGVETKEDYQFNGWLIDDNQFIPDDELELDLTRPREIEAIWKKK